jgi:hypothetical protein
MYVESDSKVGLEQPYGEKNSTIFIRPSACLILSNMQKRIFSNEINVPSSSGKSWRIRPTMLNIGQQLSIHHGNFSNNLTFFWQGIGMAHRVNKPKSECSSHIFW